jgi:DUF4097 and DUF4098 domain-containing protein YvlB
VTVRQFDTPGDVVVRVRNKSGEIRLIAHDLPTTEVEVTPLDPGGEETVAQTSVQCHPTGEGYLVDVEVPTDAGAAGGGFLRRVMSLAGEGTKARVVVRCPTGSAVDVSSASASITATGTVGAVKAKSASGDLTFDQIDGPAQIGTASGDVNFGSIEGSAKIESVSGDVRGEQVGAVTKVGTASGDVSVELASDDLTVESVSGDVKVGEAAADCRAKTTSGDISVGKATSGRVDLQAVSGDLRVGVAAGSLLHVEGESVSGDLRSEIPLDDAPPEQGGSAGPELNIWLKTISGDAVVRRA